MQTAQNIATEEVKIVARKSLKILEKSSQPTCFLKLCLYNAVCKSA